MKFVLLTMLVALSPRIFAAKATATFGGGCFWCMEAPFEKLKGVSSVVSGYMGGAKESPSYQEVSSGGSGHVEVVQVTYEDSLVSYEELLEIYWQNIDPTDSGGQFADRGSQYRTVIFYDSEKQKQIALNSKNNLEACKKYDKPIVTAIEKAHKFFPAEDYHQDYYKKNPIRYNAYKELSGRGGYIRDVASKPLKCEKKKLENKKDKVMYKKPDLKELKEKLSPLEFEVTQNDATERPFANKYWDNKEEGIYVDVVTGEPLFSSLDKYDSGSGWPAFTKPIDQKVVSTKQDNKLLMTRTEVRSSSGDSHLGHVFDDGPGPEGKRYCINSAAMRFIPKADLEKEGYGQYLSLFK